MRKMMSVKSTGNLNKIIKDYRDLNHKVVDVGIVEPQTKRKDGRNVQLAVVYRTQEQGSPKNNVPARPTLDPGVREAKYKPRVKNLVGNIGAGNGLIGLLKIGEVAALKVKSNIQGIKSPPLKLNTIRRRQNPGTNNPLVDSGQLKRGIGSKVNDKRSK